MAIDSYASLQTAVGNWLDRSDLAARVPEFITLFEGRARRELREWLTTTVALTAVAGDSTLAATVDAVLGVALNDGVGGQWNGELDLITFQDFHARMACDSAVRAPVQAVYVERDEVAGSTILHWYPPVSAASPISNVSVLAVGYLPALSDSQTTNRLLSIAPDVYLYGSLVEAAEYLQHDERVPRWEQRASQGIKALQLQTERKRFGGQPRSRALPVVLG